MNFQWKESIFSDHWNFTHVAESSTADGQTVVEMVPVPTSKNQLCYATHWSLHISHYLVLSEMPQRLWTSSIALFLTSQPSMPIIEDRSGTQDFAFQLLTSFHFSFNINTYSDNPSKILQFFGYSSLTHTSSHLLTHSHSLSPTRRNRLAVQFGQFSFVSLAGQGHQYL
jgi:hypothetical protein